MDTEALIAALAGETRPVPRHAVGRRLALGLAGGGAIALLGVVAVLGINPDLGRVMAAHGFWVKWGYSLSLGVLALVMVARLARPDAPVPPHLWLAAVPVLVVAVIGVVELALAPRSAWMGMWLGISWKKCPWIVLALSMPIFGGLLWSFRRLAPTRLRLAGATAGLAAGAFAAMLYCLHCPEMSAIFVLTWYTLGILLAASVGALLGPRLLRW